MKILPSFGQIWYRAKIYFTCISSPWYLIMVPNMNEIHQAIMEECMRTAKQMEGLTDGCLDGWTDRWTDGWTDGLDTFLYSLITYIYIQSHIPWDNAVLHANGCSTCLKRAFLCADNGWCLVCCSKFLPLAQGKN